MKDETDILSGQDVKLISLGGAQGIGLNCFAYEYKGKWLVVDCGQGFVKDKKLQDMSESDAEDSRSNCVVPDVRFLDEHKKDIVGLIITHAHDDHIGGISNVWDKLDCPIYCSEFAGELLKQKLAYAEKFLPEKCDSELPKIIAENMNYVQAGDKINLAPFNVEFVHVNHSVPGAFALAIKTDKGTIVHTGDWRLGQENGTGLSRPSDFERLKELGEEGVLALIGESTNATSVQNMKTQVTEGDVYYSLYREIKPDIYNRHARTVVTFFSSNVERMKSVLKAARATQRFVCLLSPGFEQSYEAAINSGALKKDSISVEAVMRMTGCLRDEPVTLKNVMQRLGYSNMFIKAVTEQVDYQEDDLISVDEAAKVLSYLKGPISKELALKLPRNKVVFLCSGSQGEPDSYLVRNAATFLQKGDRVIFSSRPIPGNEKAVTDLQRTLNNKLGVWYVKTSDETPLHVSGHAFGLDYEKMYKALRPKIAIAVHGGDVQLQKHREIAQECGAEHIISLKEGELWRLDAEKPVVLDRVQLDAQRKMDISYKKNKNGFKKEYIQNKHVLRSEEQDGKRTVFSITETQYPHRISSFLLNGSIVKGLDKEQIASDRFIEKYYAPDGKQELFSFEISEGRILNLEWIIKSGKMRNIQVWNPFLEAALKPGKTANSF